MNDLAYKIRSQAELLEMAIRKGLDPYSVEFDAMLGELDYLVHTARSLIDDVWRENRRRMNPKPTHITATTLEDLI